MKINEYIFISRMQLAYHNVLFYKQLNAHLGLLKQKYKEHEKEMLHFKNQLYTNKINKVCNTSI